mgnify:CR=1 FL=1
MNNILRLYEEQKDQSLDSAFLLPERFNQEYLNAYRETMLSHARKSITFLQESLSMLIAMRDRLPYGDLEAGELLFENIKLTQDCIKQEMKNISAIRGEV